MRGLGLEVVDPVGRLPVGRRRDLRALVRPHGEPELLENAVYGLTELDRERIRGADLVANPGCYPTATLLALAPLVERGRGRIGRGRRQVGRLRRRTRRRRAALALQPHGELHALRDRRPPPPAGDRAGAEAPRRGRAGHLHAASAADRSGPAGDVLRRADRAVEEIEILFAERYAGEPFVEVIDRPPGLREVRDTNLCRIHATSPHERQAVVFGAIDNLWKGAAGQAIQNLNLMLGFDETEGLASWPSFAPGGWSPGGGRGARSGRAGPRLPGDRRRLRPQGRRRDRRRAADLRRAGGELALLLTRNAGRRGTGAGLSRRVRRRLDPGGRGQLRQRERCHRRAGLRGRAAMRDAAAAAR